MDGRVSSAQETQQAERLSVIVEGRALRLDVAKLNTETASHAPTPGSGTASE